MKQMLLTFFLAAGLAFAQAPAAPPQPTSQTYGVDQLALYPSYDRVAFERKFGAQAPAFDATKKIKTWFDASVSCVANSDSSFKSLNDNLNAPALATFTVPSCDVSKVNLPGKYYYAPFHFNTVQNIQIIATGFSPTVIGAGLQSTLADAQLLKADIGDASLQITEKSGPQIPAFPSIANYQKIDSSNPVSYYMLGAMNVEQMLLQRFGRDSTTGIQGGIGSPGKWTKVSEGNYNWTPAQPTPDGTDGTFKSYPAPLRDLQANEVFGNCSGNPMFPSVCVIRKDVAPAAGVPTPGGPSTGSGDSAEILRLLKAIAALMGVQ